MSFNIRTSIDKKSLGYARWLRNTLRIYRNMFWDHLTLANIGNSISDLQISTLGTTIGPQNLHFRPGISQETFRISQHPPLGGSKASGGKFLKKHTFLMFLFLQNTKTAKTDFFVILRTHNHRFSRKLAPAFRTGHRTGWALENTFEVTVQNR